MRDQDKTKVQLIDELAAMRQRVTELEQVETQYKGTLESLEQSGRTYYDLYDNAPDMFVFVDAKTANIIRCNQTVVQALGLHQRRNHWPFYLQEVSSRLYRRTHTRCSSPLWKQVKSMMLSLY